MFNAEHFGNKLEFPELTIEDRTDHVHGWFVWDDDGDNEIIISSQCYDIGWDYVKSTLVHEMIHQYQAEVLDQLPDHGAVFNSIARHIERDTNLEIR